jgi:hypothetical protein
MDPMVAIAALRIQMSKTTRNMHEKASDAAANAEDAADRERISQMREKATHEMWSGIASGAGKAAEGLGSVAGAVGTARRNQAMQDYSPGGGKALGGGLDIVSSLEKSAANSADRKIQEAEVQGKAAKRAYDRLEKEVDSAKQHEGKLAQIVSDIAKSQEQCEKAALMRM